MRGPDWESRAEDPKRKRVRGATAGQRLYREFHGGQIPTLQPNLVILTKHDTCIPLLKEASKLEGPNSVCGESGVAV